MFVPRIDVQQRPIRLGELDAGEDPVENGRADYRREARLNKAQFHSIEIWTGRAKAKSNETSAPFKGSLAAPSLLKMVRSFSQIADRSNIGSNLPKCDNAIERRQLRALFGR